MTGPEEGLRERKRRATRDAIERHAIELVTEHGYDQVTVEMICDAAMISQRTFFNYAGSKERAVLGIDPPLPSAGLRAQYVAGLGGSPLRDLLVTLSRAFAEGGPSQADLVRRRRKILLDSPELAMREFARMEEAKQVIIDLVRARLRADSPPSDDREERELGHEAELTFAIAFGVLHHLAHEWTGGETAGEPEVLIEEAYRLARRIIA